MAGLRLWALRRLAPRVPIALRLPRAASPCRSSASAAVPAGEAGLKNSDANNPYKSLADLWLSQPSPSDSSLLPKELRFRPQERVSKLNTTWRWNQKLKAAAKSAATVLNVLHAMRAAGAPPDAITVATVLSAPLSAATAEKCFDELVTDGAAPDVCGYTLLMEHLLRAGALDRVAHYRKRMREAAVKPDLLFFNTLLLVAPDLRTAEGLMDEMPVDGVGADATSYNALFRLCRQPAELMRVAERMRSAKVRPDQYTAIALVKRLATFSLPAGLWLIRALPPAPPPEAWNALLQQFAQRARLQDTVRLFKELRAHVPPDRYSFNALLQAHVTVAENTRQPGVLRRSAHVWVQRILDDMQRTRVAPDPVTCLLLMRAYIAAGAFEQLRQLYEDMRTGTRLPQPHISHYSLLLRHAPDADTAVSYWRDMIDRSIQPNAVCYGALMYTLGAARRFDLMRQYWETLAVTSPVHVTPDLMKTILRACRAAGHSDFEFYATAAAERGMSHIVQQLRAPPKAPNTPVK